MKLEAFLDLVENHRPSGQWTAFNCPSCGRKGKGGAKAGDRGVIVRCWTGCTPEQITQAVGLKLGDLFYEKAGPNVQIERKKPDPVEEFSQAKGIARYILDAWDVVPHKRGGIVFGYHNTDGTLHTRHRWRRIFAEEKVITWAPKTGDKPIAYGAHRLELAREQRRLFIVEGESDTLTLHQAGFPALGLPGATMESKILPDYLEGVDTVYIIAEADPTRRTPGGQVVHGAGTVFPERIGRHLKRIKYTGEVRVIRLTGYNDPNDLHLAHPYEFPTRFAASVEAAAPLAPPGPPRPPDAEGGDQEGEPPAALVDEDTPPQYTATLFAADVFQGLVYHRGGFLRYREGTYSPLAPEQLKAMITRYIRDTGAGKPAINYVGNVVLNLTAHQILDQDHDLPCRMDGTDASRLLVTKNGVIDIDQILADGAATPTPHDPDIITRNALPYDYQSGAACPAWSAFLEDVMPDPEMQATLQEWFGYALIPSNRYQRILILQGEGANGKSVITSVLSELVGHENVGGQPLETIHKDHSLYNLVGKLINIAPEWGYIDSQGESTLKAISGGDKVLINPKGINGWHQTLPVRFVISTNEPPRINDRSDGLWRRLLVLPFRKQVEEERRRPLEVMLDEFRAEMPGILNWALQGLVRLHHARRFTEGVASRHALKIQRAESNPAAEFIDAHVEIVPSVDGVDLEAYTARASIFEAYRKWCHRYEYRPLHVARFGRELARWFRRSTGQEQPTAEVRKMVDGKRVSVYFGVKLVGVESTSDQEASFNDF